MSENGSKLKKAALAISAKVDITTRMAPTRKPVSKPTVSRIPLAAVVAKVQPTSPKRPPRPKHGTRFVSAVFANAAASSFNTLIGKRPPTQITAALVTKVMQKSNNTNEVWKKINEKQRLVQNYLLVWMDCELNENEQEYQTAKTKLRKVINSVEIFNDADQCCSYLNQHKTERVVLIVADRLGTSFLPRTEEMEMIQAIYIFWRKPFAKFDWRKRWSKVETVVKTVDEMLESLEQVVKQTDEELVNFHFTSFDSENPEEQPMESSFVYTQCMKDILLGSDDRYQGSARDFIAYASPFYQENHLVLNQFGTFALDYHLHTPLCWYKHGSLVYSLMNRALRNLEVEVLFKIRFLIRDMHNDIEETHMEHQDENPTEPFVVYRGHSLPKETFEKLQRCKGGFLSLDNFLIANRNQDLSISNARHAIRNADSVAILFTVTVDPTIPFVILEENEEIEKKLLFSFSTIFRIDEIETLDEHGDIQEVKLTILTNEDTTYLALMETLKKQTEESTGWHRFGQLLTKLNRFDLAEEVYLAMITETSDECDKASLYDYIASLHKQQGNLNQTLVYFERALATRQKVLQLKHPDVILSYKNIADTYETMFDYQKAIEFYEKSYEIQKGILPVQSVSLSETCDKLGNIYLLLNDNENSFSWYEKALDIRQTAIPCDSKSIVKSLKIIGSFYTMKSEFPKALTLQQQALNMTKLMDAPDDLSLAESYANLGMVFTGLHRYSKALPYHMKALSLYSKVLPPENATFIHAYGSVGLANHNTCNYQEALNYYEKALEVARNLVPPPKKSLFIDFYDKIASAYDNLKQLDRALEYYNKAFELRKQTLKGNHPEMARSYHCIGCVYFDMADYETALSYHQRAIDIAQLTLSEENPDFQNYLKSFQAAQEKLQPSEELPTTK